MVAWIGGVSRGLSSDLCSGVNREISGNIVNNILGVGERPTI